MSNRTVTAATVLADMNATADDYGISATCAGCVECWNNAESAAYIEIGLPGRYMGEPVGPVGVDLMSMGAATPCEAHA